MKKLICSLVLAVAGFFAAGATAEAGNCGQAIVQQRVVGQQKVVRVVQPVRVVRQRVVVAQPVIAQPVFFAQPVNRFQFGLINIGF